MHKKYILGLMVGMLLVLPACKDEAMNKEVEDLETQVHQLMADKDDLQEANDDLEETVKGYEKDLAEKDLEIEDTINQLKVKSFNLDYYENKEREAEYALEKINENPIDTFFKAHPLVTSKHAERLEYGDLYMVAWIEEMHFAFNALREEAHVDYVDKINDLVALYDQTVVLKTEISTMANMSNAFKGEGKNTPLDYPNDFYEMSYAKLAGEFQSLTFEAIAYLNASGFTYRYGFDPKTLEGEMDKYK